jgi:hypothetical protein
MTHISVTGQNGPSQTTSTQTIRAAAEILRGLGDAVCRVNSGTKRAYVSGWTTRSAEPWEFTPVDLLGVMFGPLSNHGRPGHALVDTDLDDRQVLDAADDYLPETKMIAGRPGKPRSHRLYLTPLNTIPDEERSTCKQGAPAAERLFGHPGPRTRHFYAPRTIDGEVDDHKGILDLLGTGAQAVIPPSNWTNTDGTKTEPREWEGGQPGEPAVVPYPELLERVLALVQKCGWKPPEMRNPKRGNGGAKVPFYRPGMPININPFLMGRVKDYLLSPKVPPAVQGSHGRNRLYAVTRVIVWEFGLGAEAAFPFMRAFYNPRCKPPFDDRDLWQKCEASEEEGYRKPWGCKLEEDKGRTLHVVGGDGTTTPPAEPPPGGDGDTPHVVGVEGNLSSAEVGGDTPLSVSGDGNTTPPPTEAGGGDPGGGGEGGGGDPGGGDDPDDDDDDDEVHADGGAALFRDVDRMGRLAQLQLENPAEFQARRLELQSKGVKIKAFDAALKPFVRMIQLEQAINRRTRNAAKGRPMICLGTDRHRVVDQAVDALAADSDVYHRGGVLVRMLDGTAGELPIVDLETRLTRLVDFVNGNEEPAEPPPYLGKAVDALGRWPRVRELTGVIAHPILRPDGSLLTTPGYDPATGLYLTSNVAVNVPEAPTPEQVRAAVAELYEVVCDFPFAGDDDAQRSTHRSAWLAALLTPLARQVFTGPAPWMITTATTPGTGKGLLLTVIGLLLTGEPMVVTPWTDDEVGLRKEITTVAVSGRSIHLFDNLTGQVGNPVIDAALTTASWGDRLLGGNKMYSGPLRTVFYGTGNNMDLKDETNRHVLLIRLTTDLEHPETRNNFVHPDLKAYVKENRGRLLSAALTILRGWVVAGRPLGKTRIKGSYESWSRVIGAALVWAEQPDPNGGPTSVVENTLANDMIAIFDGIQHLGICSHGETCPSATTSQIAGWFEPDSKQATLGRNKEYLNNMEAALVNRCKRIDAGRIGYLFRAQVGRIFGGRRLVHAGEPGREGHHWTVERAPEPAGSPTANPAATPPAATGAV